VPSATPRDEIQEVEVPFSSPAHGDRRVALSVAGFVVAVTAPDGGAPLALPPASRPFLVSSPRADLELDVRWAAPLRGEGDPLFDSGSLWRLYRDGDLLRFCFTSPAFGPDPYTTATVNQGFTSGELVLHPALAGSGAPVDPLQYPLDELLFVHLLAQGRGVEVHACGLVDEAGDGLLLLGHSGAGKTTMARLWEREQGVRILSDDRVVLRTDEGVLRMYGTPWHGDGQHARPEGAPLRRVLVLEHGQSNQVLPLDRRAALPALLARSFLPFHSALGLDFAVSFFARVVEAVPCATLRFLPTREVLSTIRLTHGSAP
jgi:hypothetical protein